MELQTLLTDGLLLAVGLLELLNDDVANLILMGLALIVSHQNILGPVTGLTELEGLASGHVQNGTEVHAGSGLIAPVSGVVDHIDGDVLLHAHQLGQVSLHDELLLDVIERRAAQRQSVARVAAVVERGGQLDGGGRQRVAEVLQGSGVSNKLLVQRPLVSAIAILSDEIQTNRLVGLSRQIVELESSLLPDVVGEVPGVGNAPLELAVVGGLDGQTGSGRLDPRHQGEISSLGEAETGGLVGAGVLVGGKQLGVPTVLLDLAREEGGHLVSSVEELVGLVVRRHVNIADSDCSGGLRHFEFETAVSFVLASSFGAFFVAIDQNWRFYLKNSIKEHYRNSATFVVLGLGSKHPKKLCNFKNSRIWSTFEKFHQQNLPFVSLRRPPVWLGKNSWFCYWLSCKVGDYRVN